MAINRVSISGNLTRDPELRTLSTGTEVLDFGVAVNDRRKNPQTDEWEDYPNFVDCSIFGKRANSLSSILRKGMKVAIDGRLRYSSWEKDGQKRSKLSVIVDEIEFMTARGDNGNGGGYQNNGGGNGGGYRGNGGGNGGYQNNGGNSGGGYQNNGGNNGGYQNNGGGNGGGQQQSVYDEDIPF